MLKLLCSFLILAFLSLCESSSGNSLSHVRSPIRSGLIPGPYTIAADLIDVQVSTAAAGFLETHSPAIETATSGRYGTIPSTLPTGNGNGQIAFQSARGSGYDIFTMYPDGSHQVNLTNTPLATDGDPNWSPDGTKIVFESDLDEFQNFDIYLMNADGTNVVRLTSDRDTGSFEIYVMNSDGSNPLRLTKNPGDDTTPDWSPDGTRIAFAHVPD